MARKRNSFVITDIKDYQKTEEKTEPIIVKNESNGKSPKKMKFSKPSDPKNFIQNEEQSEPKNETFDDRNDRSNGNPPPFKTNRFLRKCFESRREKGMILLSPKIEQKIYKLKKSLRKKGLDESEIINIIRQRRREEEIKYNKEASKNCFKCRRSGHFVADCPLNDREQEAIDICYRCGSSEHRLSECRQKSESLPFASCYLCGEVGHLTRDCIQNKRGVYPKGGECKACHSVNHLIKDCPQNQDDKELEKEITLSTFDTNHSIDAEIVDNNSEVTIKSEIESKKVIKF